MVHWELIVADVERAKAFYRRVFDWKFATVEAGKTLIDTGGARWGGLQARAPGVGTSSLNNYFEVGDLDRALEAAIEEGATVIVPRVEVPEVGSFAMFRDPEGIPFGIMQRDRRRDPQP
jgi:predicted enzyme related to lactoylglutathione lyase